MAQSNAQSWRNEAPRRLHAVLLLVGCALVNTSWGADEFIVLSNGGNMGWVDLSVMNPPLEVYDGNRGAYGNPYVPPRGSPLLVANSTTSRVNSFNDTHCLEREDSFSAPSNCSLKEVACTFSSCVATCGPWSAPSNEFAFSPDRGATWQTELRPFPQQDVQYNSLACGLTSCVVAGTYGAVMVYNEGVGWSGPFRMDAGLNLTFTAAAVWENATETVFYLVGRDIFVKFGASDPSTHVISDPGTPVDYHAIHVFPHDGGTENRCVIVGGTVGVILYTLNEGSSFQWVNENYSGFPSNSIVYQIHCQANMVACLATGVDMTGTVRVFGTAYGMWLSHQAGTISDFSGEVVGLRSLSVCGNGVLEGNERCEVDNSTLLLGPQPGNYTTQCPPPTASLATGPLFPRIDPNMEGYCPNYNESCFFCSPGCMNRFEGAVFTCGDGILNSTYEECDDGASNSDVFPGACRTNCRLPSCGDGVVDFGEDCDNGAANSDTLPNRCRSDCTWYRCGDGVVDTGELCDGGAPGSTLSNSTGPQLTLYNATGPNCTWDCQLPNCGDGVVDAYEDCDNGPANNDTTPDACRTNCRNPRCGDGVVDTGEACDGPLAGPGVVNGCKIDCTLPYCGDGVIQGDEQCDDGDGFGDCVPYGCMISDCGNGVIDSGEACDDGYGNNSYTEPNACRWNCQLPYCGDDVGDDELGEECDSADRSDVYPDRCRSDCTLPRCGDGVKDTGEECDLGDWNSLAPNYCRPDCKYPSCGDGVVEFGEECDDGAANNDTVANACRSTCLHPQCGDGVVDDGEHCDGGDCCRGNCTFVDSGTVCRIALGVCDVTETCTGWSATCPTDRFVPSGVVCQAYPSSPCRYDSYCSGSSYGCPNNYKAAGTICDDGDSCTGPFDTCNGVSSSCVSGSSNMCGCGDGVLDPLEECDDSNPNDGDGCSALCTLESGYYCDGTSCHVTTDCPDDSLVRDCNGDCGGTAYIDDCAVCTGGNTSLVPNYNKDECGVCYGGGGNKDSCGVCFGGDADRDACNVCFGDNSTCAGCDGVPNSGLGADVCGVCGGDSSSCLGCDGLPIPAGGSTYDACWGCGGDATTCHAPCTGNFTAGVPPVLFDCNGDCGGSAVVDDCGVCVGGATGVPLYIHPPTCDNSTVCYTSEPADVCGVCGGSGTSCLGCDGNPYSTFVFDVCGVCGGDGSSCQVGCDGLLGSGLATDCYGICGGNATVDACGMCSGGSTGVGAPYFVDSCGVCFGGDRDKDTCGVCGGGDASRDDCGVCFGGNFAKDTCGVCYGPGPLDACGECNGTLDCLGCDSVPNSNVEVDACGVCGGGCTGNQFGDVSSSTTTGGGTARRNVVIAASIGSSVCVIGLMLLVLFLLVRPRKEVEPIEVIDAVPSGSDECSFKESPVRNERGDDSEVGSDADSAGLV